VIAAAAAAAAAASGLDPAMHRPLPVPIDMLQLPDLSGILNMNTWSNLLTEQEQQQLRQAAASLKQQQLPIWG